MISTLILAGMVGAHPMGDTVCHGDCNMFLDTNWAAPPLMWDTLRIPRYSIPCAPDDLAADGCIVRHLLRLEHRLDSLERLPRYWLDTSIGWSGNHIDTVWLGRGRWWWRP